MFIQENQNDGDPKITGDEAKNHVDEQNIE